MNQYQLQPAQPVFFYTEELNRERTNMQCPLDQTTLVMADRQGIEIDYCPTCRGVWLDRGELDKLIAGSEKPQSYNEAPRQDYRPQHSGDHYNHDKRHKKESFLGDIFDF